MKSIDGKELVISPAAFFEVMALKGVIAKALKKDGIKIDLSSVDISADKLEDMEAGDVGWVLEPILTLMTDSGIMERLFKCAGTAMFNKCKVNADFFEDHENRKYYYPIMMEVLNVNISPFFGLASSFLKSLPGLKELVQKLKSQPQK